MKSVVRSFVAVACVGAGILVLGACNRNRTERSGTGTETHTVTEGKGTTTVTGASVTSNQAAVDRIVSARCAREATCNNIGVDKHFANAQACTDKIRADMRDDLNAKDCPLGVDQHELDNCLSAIRKEECGSPIDVISRLAACRTGDLCLKAKH